MEKFNKLFDDEFPSLFTDNKQVRKLSPNRLRKNTVTVRLSNNELSRVNQFRGQLSRSAWLRDSALQQLQPIVPEVNQEAWKYLTVSVQKLNNLASFLFRHGEDSRPLATELDDLKEKMSHVRDALLTMEK